MERLTTRNSEGVWVLKQPLQCERCGEWHWSLPDLGNGSPVDRLAEYEDLGLTPSQVKELDRRYTEKCGQIKEIVKRLESRVTEAVEEGQQVIAGAYQIAIWTIKDITGIGGLNDKQRDIISREKD